MNANLPKQRMGRKQQKKNRKMLEGSNEVTINEIER